MEERERFRRLESQPTPGEPATDAPLAERFAHLEVGDARAASAAPAGPAASPESAPAGSPAVQGPPGLIRDRFVTITCTPRAGLRDRVTLVLDGARYDSEAAGLPEEIGVLIDHILREGYSRRLLVEWRNWRATSRAGGADDREARHLLLAWRLHLLEERQAYLRRGLRRGLRMSIQALPVVIAVVVIILVRGCSKGWWSW